MRRRTRSATPGLLMTPMIDIVFQLIAFFILASNYSADTVSLPVSPPETAVPGEELADAEAVLVEIDRQGRLLCRDQPALATSDPQFAHRLETMLDTGPAEAAVVIRADRDAAYSAVDRVLAVCRQRKVPSVVLRLKVEEP